MDAFVKPALPSRGLVPIKSLGMLEEEERSRREEQEAPVPIEVTGLAAHIDHCWSDAKQAKQPVERQMLKSLRQRNGVYEPEKMAAIQKMGGSEVFVMLTSTKCRAAESWINDILRPVNDRPWSISPTPIPEIPEDLEDSLRQEVFAVTQAVIQSAAQAGQIIQDHQLYTEIRKYATSRKDEVLQSVNEEAEKRAERMADKIADQLAEGGWNKAFWGVISDFVTLKAAVLKGPIYRRKKVPKWVRADDGRWVVKAQFFVVPEFERVSPFDLYPAPDSRNPDDGYLIERHRIPRSEIQAMIGVPGYSENAIRQVLDHYGKGYTTLTYADTERDMIEFAGETGVHQRGEKIEVLEYWGKVQGKALKEWGMSGDIDPEMDYEVNAMKAGPYVIRAIINPDTMGRKPYSVDSYERIAGSFWGRGIPELMADIQDICNAVARAIVNNTSLASGPQVDVNIDRVTNPEELWPWKIWQSTNQQMTESPPINFYQPQIITDQLMRVFEFFASLTEDATGIPRWAYGNVDIGGAGATSSGLSMLMNHASRGIKEAISHVDDMVAGVIHRMYDYNMAYDEDEDIKGDCRVVALGSSSLVAKEQQMVRLRETMAAVNNPTDMQILGIEGRAKLLEAVLKNMELGVKDILPDEARLKEIVRKAEEQQMMMQQQMMAQAPKGAVPNASPEQLDPAGNPSGGVDANMFQNQPGQTPGVRVGG